MRNSLYFSLLAGNSRESGSIQTAHSAITVCDAPKAGRPSCTGHRAARDRAAARQRFPDFPPSLSYC
jgi:hypothetical protein